VHALGQVAHFDTHVQRNEGAWVRGSNCYLPETISVLWAHRTNDAFHARFSAERRFYRYIILNRKVRSATLNGLVTWEHQDLDAKVMDAAAQSLLGKHDFSAYRAAGCQASHAVRTIHELTVTRRGPFVILEISANAFLQHMVRNIAGVLMAIGNGQRSTAWAYEVLLSRDRRCAGVTAKASGLYLTGVSYPNYFALPGSSAAPELAQTIIAGL